MDDSNRTGSNSQSIAGFIVSVASWFFGFFGITGIVGLVLPAVGRSQAVQNGQKPVWLQPASLAQATMNGLYFQMSISIFI